MKNIGKILFFSFLFLITLFVSKVVTVSAKSASSEVFEVTVGDDKLPVYYELVSTSDGVKEMLKFPVELKGKESVSISYRWEHTFCYKVVGENEVCEVDLTGEDQQVENGEEVIKILGNESYNYTYYDEDMPYYSEALEFEYIAFKNKFVSLDGNNEEILLDDIRFLGNEIDYFYKFNVVIETYEKEGIEYVGYNPNGIFVNNGSSNLTLNNAPEYQIINSLCISKDKCIGTNYSAVGDFYLPITPYIGNLKFPYDSYSNFKGSEVSSISFKTSVACINNCSDTRRVKGTISEPFVIYEGSYDLYLDNPIFDISKSIVDSMDEYKKTKELKLSVKDDFSGIDEDSLYYYLAWENEDGSCPVSTRSYERYKYVNEELFEIGSKLNSGKICMYFEASSVMGNIYQSDYYHLMFDNESPTVSSNHEYSNSDYYNEVVFSPILKDKHSGVKESYYLWSKETITTSTYLKIKEEGNLYTGEISSIDSEIEDGTYNLYFLIYDNLDNYNAYRLGIFNIDTTPLSVSDVEVNADLSETSYNSKGGVTVSVNEMNSGETYKCGYLNKNDITVSDLNMDCMNGNKISLPSSLEGEYSFYAYVRDRANNYSLLKIIEDIKIDTKSPVVDYTVLYDDDKYRISNEITINVSDHNGLNIDSMKYGWFLANKSNVLSSNLVNSFENNGVIYYPNSYYGEYKLYVSVLDSVGNQTFMALDKTFKIDTDVVRISLVGDSEVTILKGEKYTDLGAKAYKGAVGSSTRTSEVTVSGNVDTSKAGVYYVVYTSGEGQFEVSVTRKVIVKSDVPYLFISVGLFGVGILVTGLRLFVKRKKD